MSALSVLAQGGELQTPKVDLAGLSPLIALLGGAIVVLMVGLLRSRTARTVLAPLLSIATFAASAGLAIWRWDEPTSLLAGALRIDPLTVLAICGVAVAGVATVVLSWRALAPREASHGEYYALLLASAAGMATFAAADDLISFFVGLELLSIPLYVLCATEMRRRRSLESGMKYLVVGSVGSATLLYGLALVYGAAGVTDFPGIAEALGTGGLGTDPLLLAGVGLVLVGLAFKVSIAPFHQWTPDVYEGAPTPITTYMATATKVAAFVALLRFLDVAVVEASQVWAPIVAALAAISIVMGNVGALGQASLKRLLAYSSVAQAGYILVGVAAGTQLGASATVLYVLAYAVMTIAAFGVVVARERETGDDDGARLDGLGASRPFQAVAMTVALLGLAGIPATVGFLAKLRLVQAAVDSGLAWLAVVLVVGSMISLAYYVPLILRMWGAVPEPARVRPAPLADGAPVALGKTEPRPQLSGGAPDDDERSPQDTASAGGAEADVAHGVHDAPLLDSGPTPPASGRAGREVVAVAVLAAVATVVLGVVVGPLMDAADTAGAALSSLF